MLHLDINYIFFLCGLLLVMAVMASRVSSLLGTPILLLFLGMGMLTGEDGFFINIVYNDYSSAYYISNFMLAIILLDGGLRTSFNVFRMVATEATVLATAGVLVTSAITGLAAYYILGLGFFPSMLVGAIVGSTDAAAVFSLLGDSGIHIKERISAVLQIESATNDPMAILLTTVLMAFVGGQATGVADVVLMFINQFAFGIIIGIIFGFFTRLMVSMVSVGPGLYALMVIGFGFTGFAITASLGGSGFLAIFIIGMIVGNQNRRQLNYVLPVSEGLTWLAQISLFLLLGLLVTPHKLIDFAIPGIVLAVVLIFIARPVAVFLCMKPFFRRYSTKELAFVSWVGLRGSVPIVLALFPTMGDVDNAQLYFNVAFVVVLCSLMLQGAMIVPAAKVFKLLAPHSAAPINKSQVGIMVSDDFELYNYVVKRHSLDGVMLRDLRFPKRTQVAALFRGGHMMQAMGDTKLLYDDIISIIGNASDEQLLNNLFSQEYSQKRSLLYKGDIILQGSVLMSKIEENFNVDLTSFERNLRLCDFMAYQIGGFAQIGDTVSLINMRLTVVELNGDQVARVGVTILTNKKRSEKEQAARKAMIVSSGR